MFCTKCGAQNADGTAFCSSCGAKLDATTQPVSAPAQNPGSSPTPSVQGKSPIVAAVLNLFWGLGYVYLGYKKVLGVPAVAFVVLAFIIYIVIGIFTVGILTFIFAVLLAVDGWQKGNGAKGFISAQ